METIGEYLTRMMRQKNLTPVDLARLCGLTDSYIGRLCKSTFANLTVDTIKKLAMAFDVNPHEIFTAASGIPVSEAQQTDLLLLLDSLQKLVTEANGLEALRLMLSISPDARQRLLDYMEHLKQPQAKSKGQSGKQARPRKKKD
jgi:transcriptional regulator with XRE-family HTH domain